MKNLILILTLLLSCLGMDAHEKTTRKGKLQAAPAKEQTAAAVAPSDTLSAESGEIVLAGYEKPLRSRRESLFATNNTASAVRAIEMELTYLDASGRMLHKRTLWTNVTLPAGETRNVNFPSWDKTQSFYYEGGAHPMRAQGTSYDIRAKVLRYVIRTD